MESFLREISEGCRLAVKVHPHARRNRIAGVVGGALKVEVTAVPERGAANRAVEKLLAELLGVPRAAVRVATGESSRTKSVIVEGLPAHEAETRLQLLRRSRLAR